MLRSGWHCQFLEQDLKTALPKKLGVALPWAIAASLVRPQEKVLSISGDGGFLFSANELETAVRLNSHFVHMVWIDGSYDMVAAQEQLKYKRTSGIKLGPVDTVKYAEAFGATDGLFRKRISQIHNHREGSLVGIPRELLMSPDVRSFSEFNGGKPFGNKRSGEQDKPIDAKRHFTTRAV